MLEVGPASAALREAGEAVRPRLAEELRKALSPFMITDVGVVMPSAAWVVTARW
jgi:hypothetical protein